MVTEGGLALVLLSHDRVPCLTGTVAMVTIVLRLIVIALLLLIVTKPGQYPALYSFLSLLSPSVIHFLTAAHDIFTRCPTRSTCPTHSH